MQLELVWGLGFGTGGFAMSVKSGCNGGAIPNAGRGSSCFSIDGISYFLTIQSVFKDHSLGIMDS